MINILFTSVGRRVELLRAFQQAYKSLELTGLIVATDIDTLAPALQIADKPYIVPRFTSPAYISTLVEICQRERIDLVFPLIDPDIGILAQSREIIEATGAQLAVIPLESATVTADKWLTTRFFHSLGIPTARSWLPSEFDSVEADFPLFIKPRRGSGGKDSYKVQNLKELAFFTNYVPDPIIQEYLPGPEITNDVVCDLTGEVLGVVSRQRIEVRWGEVAKGVTIYNPQISEACIKIAEALPAIGPITVQCMMKDGIPHFTEINARFGGGVPLGIAAGVDAPRWLLARYANIPQTIPPLGSYQTGLCLTRFDESFFLTKAERDQVATHHV